MSALLRVFGTNNVPLMHLNNFEVQYWIFLTARMAASNSPPSQYLKSAVKGSEILARVPS